MTRATRTRTRKPADPDLTARLAAFLTERFPLALAPVLKALSGALDDTSTVAIDGVRRTLRRRLRGVFPAATRGTAAPTPGVTPRRRLEQAEQELHDAVDGFLRRAAIASSFTKDERLELLRGMILTRATDNQLKGFFLGGEVRFGKTSFQGKGFRSLGQEAIYAAPLRLRRGAAYVGTGGVFEGDIVAPLIRDLGAALAMHPENETVRRMLTM